jgi:hypothetical protein
MPIRDLLLLAIGYGLRSIQDRKPQLAAGRPGASAETEIPASAGAAKISDEDSAITHRLTAFQHVRDGVHYAETITQSRLYNFLVADSLLLLAWAAVFASTLPPWMFRSTALITLAAASARLALAYMRLGARGSKFVRMHYDQLAFRESLLPDELKLSTPLAKPQNTGVYTLLFPHPGEETTIRLTDAEHKLGKTHLTVEVPRYMFWTSLVLMAVSLADAGWQTWLTLARR